MKRTYRILLAVCGLTAFALLFSAAEASAEGVSAKQTKRVVVRRISADRFLVVRRQQPAAQDPANQNIGAAPVQPDPAPLPGGESPSDKAGAAPVDPDKPAPAPAPIPEGAAPATPCGGEASCGGCCDCCCCCCCCGC